MIDTAVSLATLQALEYPASPRNIPANTTLAELEQIRLGWIAQARAQGIPDKLYQVAYWLGSQAPDDRGIFRLYTVGNLRIWASVKIGTRNVTANAWNMTRGVVVYLDAEQQQRVTSWTWHYVGDYDDVPAEAQEGADLLYIPGAWTTTALAMTPKAEAARVGYARAHETKERDELARKLLVGMEV